MRANIVIPDRKPATADPWERETWTYDLRTNKHFVDCYRAEDRSKRVKTEPFRRLTYDELIARHRANLGRIWLRDEWLDDASPSPSPDVRAAEIVEELEAVVAQFSELAASRSVDLAGSEGARW